MTSSMLRWAALGSPRLPRLAKNLENSSMSSKRTVKFVDFKLSSGACVCHLVSAAAFLSRGLAPETGRGQGKSRSHRGLQQPLGQWFVGTEYR